MLKTAKMKILIWLFILIPQISFAQKEVNLNLELIEKPLPFGLTKTVPVNKPIVSLVLSGGGARAFAHLGALKAAEELNIKFDDIIGTSMGSVIGGLYAAGYNVAELDSIMNQINWTDILSFNDSDRKNLFVDQKITEDRALLSLRLDNFRPIIPTYLNKGHKISNVLTTLSLNAPLNQYKNFDDLLYRFRAISTELVTGKKIIISDGSLSEAMKSSSSVSFLLPPIHRDSLILVDGGLVENLPVKTALELNADFIIASDATSSLRKKEDLIFPWEIADQIVSIPSKIILDENKFAADILISYNLDNAKNIDFSKFKEITNQGYIIAKKSLVNVKARIDSLFYSRLSKDNKFFTNFSLNSQPNELEKKLFNKYSRRDSISKAEILFDLYSLMNEGIYKSLSAKIISDTNSVLFVNYELNGKINRINIQGVKTISVDTAKQIFIELLNKPYNSSEVLSKILELIKIFRNNNNLLATIERVKFDENSGTLDLIINEGKISELIVEGNEKTVPSVITREFSTKNGDILSKTMLEEGLKNITSTDLFNDVKLSLINSQQEHKLKITVSEKTPNVIRFGLRIDNENFSQVAFDIRNENLFGTGSELGASISGGIRNISYIIEHKTNRIFNTYFTYKLQGFYKFNDIINYNDKFTDNNRKFDRIKVNEYRQIFYGGFIGLGTNYKKLGTITAEWKYEIDEIKNLSSNPFSPAYKANISTIKLRLVVDSKNTYPFPTSGSSINSFYETSLKLLGGDISFAKLYFDYSVYLSPNTSHTFKPRIEFGFADETLPLSQQFSFGGQNSFFGYHDYDYRGRQIFIASLEYRYKLPIQIYVDTYFKFRYDLGSSWSKQEQIKFKDLKHGVGLSISLDSPIGPAEFSVGRSYIFKQALPKTYIQRGPVYFYFTIGYYY